jgi:hypothetical protein
MPECGEVFFEDCKDDELEQSWKQMPRRIVKGIAGNVITFTSQRTVGSVSQVYPFQGSPGVENLLS